MFQINLLLTTLFIAICSVLSADPQKVFEKAVDDLRKSEMMANVLRTGSKAPDFKLFNQKGKRIELNKLLREGPVILTFYRGSWCSYCNQELKALRKILPALEEYGATLVAVTPELGSGIQKTARLIGSDFSLLSDVNSKVSKAYKVVFRLPDNVNALYKDFGIDLNKANGENSQSLPLAATYLIDRDGKIRFDFVEADYKKRVDKSKLLASLKSLQGKVTKTKAVQQALLQIKEVHCGGCASTIKKRLMALEGVQHVVVSFKTGKAKVTYNSDVASLEKVKKAVGKGFPVISAKKL